MKILVTSDNHGDADILTTLKQRWASQVDLMVHCGDSELAPTSKAMADFQVVKGNNDYHFHYPDQLTLLAGADQLLVVHGDHDHVNASLTPLLLKAQQMGVKMVCYGHTHQLAVTTDSGILFLNPGSISLPRGKYAYLGGTFAIVDVQPKQWVIDYYTRNSVLIPELHFVFAK